jgi:hypothetical protein
MLKKFLELPRLWLLLIPVLAGVLVLALAVTWRPPLCTTARQRNLNKRSHNRSPKSIPGSARRRLWQCLARPCLASGCRGRNT